MNDWGKYEKITDDIMIIANRLILRMNVGLSHYSNDNKRYNYHREVEFYSEKAYKNLINIKRNYDYYLSIEHIVTKEFIRIGISEISKLRHALNELEKYFIDKKYENLFIKVDGELRLYMNVDPIIIDGLPMDKFIRLEPAVIMNYRGETEQGVRISFPSDESSCDISMSRFETFKYIIDEINLFESAQLMINYLQRPEFGTNLYMYNNESYEENNVNFSGTDGRKITKNLSYFDKMSRLE